MNKLRKRQTRMEILKQEIEDCHTILETAYIERDIALAVNEIAPLSDIGEQIIAMLRRIEALKNLLDRAENPCKNRNVEDFIGWIIIKPGGTGNGEKMD